MAGDFVLIPAASAFAASSLVAPSAGRAPPPVDIGPGVFRLGPAEVPPDLRMLVGHCTFASDDTELLLSLLPRFVHVRGVGRLAMLLGLVNEETRGDRPGREVVLARLLEVLLIEALRSTTGPTAPSGLLRGLADERVATALRRMHERPTVPWTVAALAREADCRARHSSNGFGARSASRRWRICWRGASRWRRICSVAREPAWRRWPSAWATGLPAPSAPPSPVMSADRQFTTPASSAPNNVALRLSPSETGGLLPVRFWTTVASSGHSHGDPSRPFSDPWRVRFSAAKSRMTHVQSGGFPMLRFGK